MFDKVITITVNPSVDATLWVDKLDFEEPASCKKRKDYPGGKGINVSRVLTALGISTYAISVAGEENLHKLKALLNEDGVDFELIANRGATRENLTLSFPNSQLLKINFPGFEIERASILQLLCRVKEAGSTARHPLLVFAGSLPQAMTADKYKELILACKQAVHNCEIVLDNDIFTIADLKELSPFAIKPNHVELAHMFKKKTIEREELPLFARELARLVPHMQVLVSLGGGGLLYENGGEVPISLCALVPTVEVKSTVGAGDTTLAGFLAALCFEKPIEKAVRFAAACGTASVMLEGTQAITRAEAEEMFNQITLV